MNLNDFFRMKEEKKPISMITCYDSWSAAIIEQTNVDCILVGDSLAMVMHGHETTIPADVALMSLHIKAVRRGAPKKFIIGDMPFLSFRKGLKHAMNCVERFMKAGANAVKLEGVAGHLSIIHHIIESGIPVMGHIGLTPQSINQFGGYKVQGKTKKATEELIQQAKTLEKAGCFSIVIECVPSAIAQEISKSLEIPIIGIGAGKDVDGQVLVLQDLLGMSKSFRPKFARRYLEGFDLFCDALNNYDRDVKDASFPAKKESF